MYLSREKKEKQKKKSPTIFPQHMSFIIEEKTRNKRENDEECLWFIFLDH